MLPWRRRNRAAAPQGAAPLRGGAGLEVSRNAFRASAALLAVGIFLIDVLTPLEGAVAVLYVVVVLLAARTGRVMELVAAAVACVFLTVAAYFDSHGLSHAGSASLRAVVSFAAIVIVALLAVQNLVVTASLQAQARLLDLSHDMIVVRDRRGTIIFWNKTAEDVYGWSAQEAVGRLADDILCTRYPADRADTEAELMRDGRWDGTLEQRTRAGARLTVESRWALQSDRRGRPVRVLETHTDVTERQAALAALVQSERRYRRMFDASRVGVAEQDWSAVAAALASLKTDGERDAGDDLASHEDFVRDAKRLVRIRDANAALLKMVGVDDRTKLPASLDQLLPDSDTTFPLSIAAFARGDPFFEGETEIRNAAGDLVPVLFAITFPREADGDALVFVVDITERRQAQDEILAAQSNLAHAARVATMVEFTASIAHEVNQPLMAVVTSGEAALRWLRRPEPDLAEATIAIGRVVSEGRRAGDIVSRIRDFLKKSPACRARLDVTSLVKESVLLVEREVTLSGARIVVELTPGLPPLYGDRVQLQQVLVNLILNAAQAMSGSPAPRILTIRAMQDTDGCVALEIEDTGPGLPDTDLARVFQPFFTTKEQGMGMGLTISRSTVEAHGGRLTVHGSPGTGARFVVTLPAADQDPSP